jgi:dTDP-4-dehydrorhamnose reductase
MNKVLVLGDGLLGSEIVRQAGCDYISRKKDNFDICDISSYYHKIWNYKTIVNCVANTNTYGLNKSDFEDVNYKAVADIFNICNDKDIKFVQISSDYLYSGSEPNATEESLPIPCPTWYGHYKLLADEYIKLKSYNYNYLIIRTSFKPRPFPWDFSVTQRGNFMYVDEITSLIIRLIQKGAEGVFNVGRKEPWTMYEMALQTKPDVEPWFCKPNKLMPDDISMNVSKMEKFLNE